MNFQKLSVTLLLSFFFIVVCFLGLKKALLLPISPTENTSQLLDISSFKQTLDKAEVPIIINLCVESEILATGFIPNSTFLNYHSSNFYDELGKLNKKASYFLYCRGGKRSDEVSIWMEEHKFQEVYALYQGYDKWIEKGFPIEKYEGDEFLLFLENNRP